MDARRGRSGRKLDGARRALAVVLSCSLLGLAGIAVVGEAEPALAAGVPRDGLTSETAAPSCWSIKQSYPASVDGIYWLSNPKLVYPQQFYCDQTTEGGGWVLIGRGRDGWSFPYWGQNSPTTLRSTITGPAAFDPSSLATPTVDGLMNGGRMDALGDDGIRLRRATNTTGTTWQEARLRVKTYGKWSWAFGGGIYLSSVKFDNTTTNLASSNYQTNTTANVQVGNDARRVFTYPWSSHNYRAGFSFGSSINNGTNSATSYLWEFANENSAVPFTQVFIRPKISEADVAAAAVVAPDAGLAGSTVRAMLDHRPTTQPWGVTGINNGVGIPSLGAHVTAFADIGNTIYVGGKFLQVQQGPGGATFNQPYLAAFDKTTGGWISTFNPVLNGIVWKLKASPDGTKLFVGGEFTSVNGQANTGGLAALDPTTGAPVASWTGYVSRTTGASDVRAMDVQNGFLYIGGLFNRVSGGTGTQFLANVVVGRLARLRLTDGRPDGTWKPNVETAPMEIDASAQNDRAYAVGLFQTLNGVTLNPSRLAVIDATTAAAVPGLQPWKPNAPTSTEWQNTILEVGDKVFQGGSQHILHQYNRSTYALERSHMTKSGGDYQAIAYRDGIVYGACHCENWQYQDANTWSDPSGYTQVNPIDLIGAYDTTNNFEVLPEFHPTALDLTGATGEGPWELFVDSNNCMWAGGDLMRAGTTASPFYGGFERFCGRDATAPSVPANAQVAVAGNDVTLTWNPSTDNVATPIRYEVLKDDPTFGTVVMASTFDRTVTDTNVVGPTRYFIRAIDAEGNSSATTAVLNANPPPPAAATLLTRGASWSYEASGDQGSAWRQPAFNTSAWPTGTAELGWGDGDEVTAIPTGAITQYFVKHVTVTNPSQYKTVTVRLKRDDGAAVYVNGIEVARDNLPAGPLTATTPAVASTSGTQETTFYEFQVPASLFVDGDNTIAVELHQADAGNVDASFDLELVARNGTETNLPSTPAPAASSVTQSSLTVTWPASTDDTGVIGYLVRRNGALAMFTTATSFPESGLVPATAYAYDIRAVDSSGNVSTANVLNVTTLNAPPADPLLFSDAFTGATGAAWGTGWTTSVTGGGTATQQSGTGQLAVPNTAGAYSRSLLSGLAARTNSETLFSYQFNSATAAAIFSVFARGSGGWQNEYRPTNGYGLELQSNSGTVTVRRNVAGTATTLATVTGARQVSTAKQWLRFRVNGTTIQFRSWVDGQSEPTTWTSTVTDSGLATAGQLHLSLVRGTTNTGSKDIRIDDLQVTDPAGAAPDTTPPSAPTGLASSNIGQTQATLSWSAATDNQGVTGYQVVRNGTVLPASVSGLTYTDTGLAPATSYTYTTRAFDAAGNFGPDSNSVVVTTLAVPDTTPPSAPTGLASSNVLPTQVTLSWTAATDNQGVTGYQVVRNGTVLPGSVSGLTYTDTLLAPGASYTYTTRAFDAAGNVGPDSNAVTVVTPAADPSLFSDTFTGATGAAWGTGWTTSVSGGTATQQSGTGQLALNDTAGAYSRSLLSGLAARANSETLFSYQFNSATAAAYFSVFARGSGGWQNGYRPTNGYGLEITSSSGTVYVKKNVAGTTTQLASVAGARQVSTAKQWIRLRVSGSTIQFRTWVDGAVEPSTWSSTITDTSVTAAGQLYLSIVRGGSNTGLKDVRIDDVRVLDAP